MQDSGSVTGERDVRSEEKRRKEGVVIRVTGEKGKSGVGGAR